MPEIVYIHGFLSSPDSQKAQQTKKWLMANKPDVKYFCPKLSSYPNEAISTLKQTVDECVDKPFIIGSSLGGFWASYLIEQGLAQKAVLVNPAVAPHKRFVDRVGVPQKSYYSEEVFTLQPSDLDLLGDCEAEKDQLSLNKYWVMLQTEDEVLDYRMAEQRYEGAKLDVEVGGNHSFVGFDNHLPGIMDFFGL